MPESKANSKGRRTKADNSKADNSKNAISQTLEAQPEAQSIESQPTEAPSAELSSRQFFHEDASRSGAVGSGAVESNRIADTNRALYTIPGKDGAEETQVLVECIDGGGDVPRNATSFRDFASRNMETEMVAVARVAETVVDTLKRLSPGTVQIEFGIELGGKAGIPLITSHEGKANFKVTLKWERGKTP